MFPAIVGGLFTRWFHRWALLAGWLAGEIFGTIAAYKVATPTVSHWAGSTDLEFGHTVYIGLSALILNVAIAVVLTLVLKASRLPEGADETLPEQYTADPAEAPAPAPAAAGLGRVERPAAESFWPNGPWCTPVRSANSYRLVASPAWYGSRVTAGCRPWRWPGVTAYPPCSRCPAGTCSRCTTRRSREASRCGWSTCGTSRPPCSPPRPRRG